MHLSLLALLCLKSGPVSNLTRSRSFGISHFMLPYFESLRGLRARFEYWKRFIRTPLPKNDTRIGDTPIHGFLAGWPAVWQICGKCVFYHVVLIFPQE